MNRQHYNKQILELLSAYVDRYPDMRFGQMLSNLNIASHILEQFHDSELKTTRPVYKDIFFPESEETLATVMLSYPKEGFKE